MKWQRKVPEKKVDSEKRSEFLLLKGFQGKNMAEMNDFLGLFDEWDFCKDRVSFILFLKIMTFSSLWCFRRYPLLHCNVADLRGFFFN